MFLVVPKIIDPCDDSTLAVSEVSDPNRPNLNKTGRGQDLEVKGQELLIVWSLRKWKEEEGVSMVSRYRRLKYEPCLGKERS